MYFKLVKRILDKYVTALAQAQNKTEKEILQQIGAFLDLMRKEWFSGKAPTIAYDDPICRLAYIFAHVPVHAALFEEIFAKIQDKLVPANAEELRVLVFGGGPGTELLGLAKHFIDFPTGGTQIEVMIDIVDRVTAWNESINWIRSELKAFYEAKHGKPSAWPARFNPTNYTIDFGDQQKFGNLPTLFDKDLFVFCFVVSEIFETKTLLPLLKAMVAGSPPEARFLFIDRSDDSTKERLKELTDKAKLKHGNLNATKSYMDGDEQKSVLKKYSDIFGKAPRHTWDACWVLARKT